MTLHPTHIEAVADAAASSMRRDAVSEPGATEVSELQKVIYGYFGPSCKINTYKTPEQQDRELAEAILAAGYSKAVKSPYEDRLAAIAIAAQEAKTVAGRLALRDLIMQILKNGDS